MRALLVALAVTLTALATAAVVALLIILPPLADRYVIPPGREPQVRALVEPLLRHGFAGRIVGGIGIDRTDIRLAVAPASLSAAAASAPAAAGTRSASAVEPAAPFESVIVLDRRDCSHPLEATAHAATCGCRARRELSLRYCVVAPDLDRATLDAAATAALARLDPRHLDELWRDLAGPDANVGLLTPAARATRLDARWLAVVALLLGLGTACAAALGVAAARPRGLARDAAGPPPGPHAASGRAWRVYGCAVALITVTAVAVHVVQTVRQPEDIDESWARPAVPAILNSDHDAWVHPPLHRAVQQLLVRALRWHQGDSLLRLRALSLAAALATLAAFAGLLLARPARWWAITVGALVLCSPLLAAQGALARPYGLASFLVATLMVAAAALRADVTRAERGLATFVLGAAAVLTCWTDLVAGGGALALGATALLDPRARVPRGARVLLAVAVLVGVAALAPGAVAALRDQVTPGAGQADLSPALGIGRGSAPRQLGVLLQLSVPLPEGLALAAGGALFAIVLVAAWRARQIPLATALVVVAFGVALAATRVRFSARHLLFFEYAYAVLVAVIGQARPAVRAPEAATPP